MDGIPRFMFLLQYVQLQQFFGLLLSMVILAGTQILFRFFSLILIAYFADSPSQHPRIDKEEQEYIEKSLGENISKKKVNSFFSHF